MKTAGILTAGAGLAALLAGLPPCPTRASALAEPIPQAAQAGTSDAIAGRALIMRAARRFGEAGRRIGSIHYSVAGVAFNGLQGYDPADIDRPRRTGRFSFVVDFDYLRHQYRRRVVQALPGGITLDTTSLYRDGNIVTHYATGRSSRRTGQEAELIDRLARYCPPLLVAHAIERLDTVRLIGTQIENRRAIDLVAFEWSEGSRMQLHLDHADGRVVALEVVDRNPSGGEDSTIYRFLGERIHDGLPYPERVEVVKANRRLFALNVIEAQLDPVLPARLFDAPSGDRPLEQVVATHDLGNGVYEIAGLDEGSFRVLFFDLGDAVAIFDAPGSNAKSALVADRVRLALGDKPIRYLIVSHFHNDHIAGVGYYVDRNVQIVTSRAAAPVIARFARAAPQADPNPNGAGRSPNFLFVDGPRLELGRDPRARLTVYRLPNSPHSRDMLVAYAPRARLIVQADLAVDLAAFSNATRYLARWMRARNAPRIERIAGTHLAPIPRSELDRVLSGRR